jgi:hypothetical protein
MGGDPDGCGDNPRRVIDTARDEIKTDKIRIQIP